MQWLLVIRFLVGIGLGGVPVAFALFAEFCPVVGRGGWLIALQAFWTFGSMAEAAIAWGVLVPLGWRVLLALSAAPFGERFTASRVIARLVSCLCGFTAIMPTAIMHN